MTLAMEEAEWRRADNQGPARPGSKSKLSLLPTSGVTWGHTSLSLFSSSVKMLRIIGRIIMGDNVCKTLSIGLATSVVAVNREFLLFNLQI